MNLYFKPKNKEIEQLMERLCQYPFQYADPKIAQALSRHKKIRYINKPKRRIVIQKGTVGLKPNVRVIKLDNGFKFEIF